MIADIAMYESGSGGELSLTNEDLTTIQGLTNQVYLALFGGNTEQSTSDDLNELDQRSDWWGNAYLSEENQFNSDFERTIREVALTGEGLSRLEDAAKNDLKYLSDYADIEIEASKISLNRVQILVNLTEPDSRSTKIKFIWDGTRNELIEQIII